MHYLITNKMIKFLLFASFAALISCSSNEIRPPEQTKLTQSNDNVSDRIIKPEQDSSAQAPDALWQRLFSQYQFPLSENARVQTEIDWYSKHPEYIERVQKNAAPYLYFIVEEVEKRGLPGELALLPVVESAFKPFAYSHGRAAGLWQFIPSTGTYFGLKQNQWYDGRRDVYASTDAALTYLSRLSTRFDNDWLLVLAAYNAGGGTISKAMKRNTLQGKQTDYWSLTVHNETHRYVPKLIAIAHILSNAEQYNVSLIPIPNQSYFEKVDTVKQIDLARAAELADMSLDDLYDLNPAFNQWATDPQGPHYLLIPTQQAPDFKKKLAALPDNQRLKWQRHQVKSGETLGHIAKKYRTSITLIKQNNNLANNTIRAGKYLLIPTASFDDTLYSRSADMRKKAIVSTQRAGQRVNYSVKQGDSFWRIAKAHGVSVRNLAKWNAMAPADPITIGQELAIWIDGNHRVKNTLPSPRSKKQTIRYVVRNGDSLYRISQKFNVSITDLKRWNTLNKKHLRPGQKLKIIVDVTRS